MVNSYSVPGDDAVEREGEGEDGNRYWWGACAACLPLIPNHFIRSFQLEENYQIRVFEYFVCDITLFYNYLYTVVGYSLRNYYISCVIIHNCLFLDIHRWIFDSSSRCEVII